MLTLSWAFLAGEKNVRASLTVEGDKCLRYNWLLALLISVCVTHEVEAVSSCVPQGSCLENLDDTIVFLFKI